MRRRNMYYLTGLPGFMRFGHSPGWIGRSPSGLGPCAQFMMTSQWPTPQAPMAQGTPAGAWPTMDAQTRLEFLKNQASILEKQLEAIKAQISGLEESQE